MKKGLVKDYVLITIGIVLVAIGVEYFFAPNDLAAGGITGLAIIINKYVPSIGIGIITFIVNGVLFGVAFLFIDGNFGGRSIYSSTLLSLIMWAIEKFLNPFAITQDLFIATVFGTIISAIGMAIVFNANSSTGGTDIIAKLMNKYLHLDIGKSLLIVDFIITFVAALVFGLTLGFYAMLSVILLGIMIDKLIEGLNVCKQVIIVSNESEEISKFIIKELDRGCTCLKGFGGYSNDEKFVIYTVLDRSEFIKLKNRIREIDKHAFITVGEVHEVFGEGFKVNEK
ncbi:YitT family protein [uncultured Clostridium sp.]|uniref:YitT family protein n=1 Tax=uncultured Clostridium sp. TaxID=59620 RepID=UPI00262A3188|nr:YitT family protein [uncultured Clostridium sp.]